ncbi:MAG: cobalamin-binding protein [Oceanospirillaceae bacterium]|nr:cobalamin-binding protein [Oceanospirillaceae bacterium]
MRRSFPVYIVLVTLLALQHAAAAPERIVALSPELVENLYAVGAGEQIVGRVAHSDFPESARKLPVVGDFQQLNIEAILALQPDLILAWNEGNPPADLRRLQDLGLNVVALGTPNLEALPETLAQLGRLTGHRARAERLASRLQSRLDGMAVSPSSPSRPVVFYQLWDEPLLSVSGKTLIGQALSFCGGNNPLASRPEPIPQVSVEAVLTMAPDLIISTDEVASEWRDRWQSWNRIPAVANQRLFTVKADLLHRATPRFLDGLEQLCRYIEQSAR